MITLIYFLSIKYCFEFPMSQTYEKCILFSFNFALSLSVKYSENTNHDYVITQSLYKPIKDNKILINLFQYNIHILDLYQHYSNETPNVSHHVFIIILQV